MSVSRQNIDSVSAKLTVKIVKEDYQEKVEKGLKDIRKKANVPGFRPGNVPAGMVKKMYGKSVLAEQVNKLISDQLYTYIRENELPVLGEPLPVENENEEQIDFEKDEEFSFDFEVALAPELTFELSAEDKVKYYEIAVSEEMVERQVKAYTSRAGKNEIVEGPAEENDMIRGNLVEQKEDGITKESTILVVKSMVDEAEKAKFAGVAKGDIITFNLLKAYGENTKEVAYLLHLDKDADVSGFTSDFTFEVTEISRFKEAEMNQELFDAIFGEGTVTTEEEFTAKIKETLATQMVPESDYKFLIDIRTYMMDKVGALTFPERILKRFLVAQGGGNTTTEQVEDEFPNTLEGLKWQLIKEKLVKDNAIKLEEADVKEFAVKVAQSQFAQYGMMNVPAEVLEKYAVDMLKDQKRLNSLVERAIEEKLIAVLKEKVTLDKETVTIEEFNKFFEGLAE